MTPDDPRPFVRNETSQRVGIRGAVVGGIRVSYAAGAVTVAVSEIEPVAEALIVPVAL
jgi:hypothetical protein